MRWSRIAGLALGISGCNAIAGINAGTPRDDGAGGSQPGCIPGETRSCYEGPAATKDIGTCRSGMQTCDAEGTGFDACATQVLPAMMDDCTAGKDVTCDGKLTCPCSPNETKTCYDGLPATTAGVGICKSGTRTCNAQGSGYDECVGEIKPTAEDCATPDDENCDGTVNEAVSGCVCDPKVVTPVACDAPQPGECAKGTKLCAADGKSYDACAPKMPGFEDCFTTADEDCDGMPAVACVGGPILAVAPGAPAGDGIVFDIASDATGNIIFGGVSGSSGGSNYGLSSGAAEITKLDKTGKQLWTFSYPASGANNYSVVHGVAVDGMGNVLLIGEYQGAINSNGVVLSGTAGGPDVFVIKLDTDGKLKWSKSFGGSGDQFGTGVATDANGGVFITGTMNGTTSFDTIVLTANGSADVFVAKLDVATGKPAWSKNFGDGNFQLGRQVAAASNGDVFVTGQFLGAIDFGSANIVSAGAWDIFIARLAGSDGKRVWSKGFGDGEDQVSYGLAVDKNDNVAITGTLQGTTDFGGGPLVGSVSGSDIFAARFDSGGGHLWSKRFGDTNNAQTSRDVAVDGAGNVLITGYFKGSLQFEGTTLTDIAANNAPETNVFVAKLKASDGSLGWARSYGDIADQVAWTVAADPLGSVILGGTFQGTLSFGPPAGSLTNVNNYDAFWAKLSP